MVGAKYLQFSMSLAYFFCEIWIQICIQEALCTKSFPEVLFSGYKDPETGNWTSAGFVGEPMEYLYENKSGVDLSVSILNSVSKVKILCHANYPIYWAMTDVQPTIFWGVEMRTKVEFNEEELISGNSTNILAKQFHSHLILYNHPSLTGRYTCQSAKNDELKKSVYVFAQGFEDLARNFSSTKTKLEVGVNGRNEIIIPCKVTRPNAYPNLNKKNGVTGELESVPFNFSFDPQIGFIIGNVTTEDIIGTYVCSLTDSDENLFVKVNEEYNSDLQFPIRELTDGSAGWKRRRFDVGIECCSNSSVAPRLLIVECKNKPHCEMMKKTFMEIRHITPRTEGLASVSRKRKNDSCVYTTEYIMVQPFIMQCFGDGIDVSGEYRADFDLPSKEIIKYVPSSVGYDSDTEASIKIKILKWKNMTIGEEEDEQYQYFEEFNPGKVDIIAGEKFAIDCCGLFYNFAVGRVQLIGWKNGSVTKLNTPDKKKWEETNPYAMDFCHTYGYDAEEDDESILIADQDMEYFECIVPLWYDPKPIIQRIELNVGGPEEPQFPDEDIIQNFTFNENQQGLLMLHCALTKGFPKPTWIWTKDGYKLSPTDRFWSIEEVSFQSHETTLLFMRAVKEIEGEYDCEAKNSEGVARQSFNVRIKPRSYMDYWVALAIFGGFFAIRIVTMEKRFSRKKTNVSSEIEDLPQT